MKDHIMKFPYYYRIKQFLNHYLGGLYKRADEHHIFLLGGSLAFSLFVCTIPLVLVIFFVLGIILEESYVRQQIVFFIDRIIPYSEYASFIKRIIFSRVSEIIAYKTLAGYVGVLGLLIAASGLFSTMRTALNTIFKGKGKKPSFAEKFKDFGIILLVLAFFLISTAILPTLEIIKDSAYKIEFLSFFRLSAVQKSLFSILAFLIIFLLFFALYYFLPHEKLSKRAAIISAFWGAILWEIAKQAFGYYITNLSSLGRIYGAYALIIVVAFWIYYSSLVFLLGAEIGQLYSERIRDISITGKSQP